MRDRYRKRLSKYFALAPDEGFTQLVWAANTLQSGFPKAALPYLQNVDADAITQDLTNPRHMHKWELETAYNDLLFIAKRKYRIRGQWRQLDCRNYNALVNVLNALKALSNAEAGLRLARMSVLAEMPRISAQQFDWQRGWLNIPQFYRSTFIYGQGAGAEYFKDSYGLSINEFSFIGFALHTHFCDKPIAARMMDLRPLPISPHAYEAALKRLAIPIDEARQKAREVRRKNWPLEYQPSILRSFPCISFGLKNERIRSPLPQLILERTTSGIFYDIAGAGWQVREEYGRNFEEYALRYLRCMLPAIDWQPEHAYKWKKAETKSPDLLWTEGAKIRLAIECKATRMSIDARYGDDPLLERGYEDIVKAIFQLWRYFSHCRRGLTGKHLDNETLGIVLTLDSWLLMASELIEEVMKRAIEMSADKDPDIGPEDRRPILFCAITDLENTLATATEATFEAALQRAVAEKRQGWLLSSSHDDVRPEGVQRRPYPFQAEVGELLPWWAWIEEKRDRQINDLVNL